MAKKHTKISLPCFPTLFPWTSTITSFPGKIKRITHPCVTRHKPARDHNGARAEGQRFVFLQCISALVCNAAYLSPWSYFTTPGANKPPPVLPWKMVHAPLDNPARHGAISTTFWNRLTMIYFSTVIRKTAVASARTKSSRCGCFAA